MPNQRYYLKLVIIACLILFLLIPQAFMLGLVGERVSWRHQAYSSIEQSWSGMQTLAGPLLTIPYQLTYNVKERVKDKDGKEREILREVTDQDALHLIPNQLDITSTLDSSLRYRGIYDVPVYSSDLQVSGTFNTQPLLDLIADTKGKQIRWENPQLAVMVRETGFAARHGAGGLVCAALPDFAGRGKRLADGQRTDFCSTRAVDVSHSPLRLVRADSGEFT